MKLEALFDQLHTLPTVPKVAQDLIRQFDDPDTNIDTLAHTIERDPVIAAKVLRLANSARFHGLRDSTSVEDAAMRLGFNTLRTLVLASAMTGAFRAGPGFDLKAFWRHSFEVAGICRLLARQHENRSGDRFHLRHDAQHRRAADPVRCAGLRQPH